MKTIAIDLDGTLARYDGYKGPCHIGDPIPGAVDFVRRLAADFRVLIHTARMRGEAAHLELPVVLDWLARHGFAGPNVEVWLGQGKPLAVAYIDDRAVPCRPQDNPSPHVTYAFAAHMARSIAGIEIRRELEETCEQQQRPSP